MAFQIGIYGGTLTSGNICRLVDCIVVSVAGTYNLIVMVMVPRAQPPGEAAFPPARRSPSDPTLICVFCEFIQCVSRDPRLYTHAL